MASNKQSATFSINLEGDAPAVSAELAARLEKLRQGIQGSTDKIGQMSKALRGLRGTSEDVVAAKTKLKAALALEKDNVSAANLEILKHGVVLSKAAAETEKAGESSKLLGTTFGIAAIGIAAASAAIVGATVSLVKWIITAGDAGRDMALMREAFAGSAENGAALGTQVDALARKVPIAKDKLNEMAVQLMRTRLTGQQLVDTFNIMGEAGAAMGDDVGKTLGDLVKRGALFQRFRINPLELVGTGIQYTDVAKNLGKQLGIGITDAKARLFEGRVTLSQGAEALRKTVEERFGAVNAKKLLSLTAITQSLHDRFIALTKNVDMDRILKPISDIAMMFDASTITGKALQDIITVIGKLLGDTATKNTPLIQDMFEKAELGFLSLAIWTLRSKKYLGEMWLDSKRLAGTFFDVIMQVGTELGRIAGLAVKLGEALGFIADKLGLIDATGARPLTPEEVDAKRAARANGAISSVGLTPAQIQAAPNADGGVVGYPAPGEAFASVAPGEMIIPRGGGMRGGNATLNIAFAIHGGGSPAAEIQKQLSEPTFLAAMTHAIEMAAKSAGIPAGSQP